MELKIKGLADSKLPNIKELAYKVQENSYIFRNQ